ncbi:MAG: transposase [Deltaproteobacteria bacterium]|jgi:hypothetical protein|nr:transposase [Deltaproteobacteria bacterium]
MDALEDHSGHLDRLETIPGVSRLAAASVLAEIGPDMAVFGSSERLCKWGNVCPGNNESGGKSRSGRTAPGNKCLRRTLCECAHAAAKTADHFASVFKGIKARRGYKRAVVAVAHRLLRTVYVLISRDDVYRDRAVDYESLAFKKRLPRWVEALKRLEHFPPRAMMPPAKEARPAA